MSELLTHSVAFVAGIGATIIAQVIGHRIIRKSDASDLDRAETARFNSVAGQVPDVIERVRSELKKPENALVQQLVAAPTEGAQLQGGRRSIYLYESQHEQLHEKLDRLVQEGYLEDVGRGNARILSMSKDFVSRLRPGGH